MVDGKLNLENPGRSVPKSTADAGRPLASKRTTTFVPEVPKSRPMTTNAAGAAVSGGVASAGLDGAAVPCGHAMRKRRRTARSQLIPILQSEPHRHPWSQLVLCVVRGGESISFDGSHLEKRPDLAIYLSNGARHFPLVVEAKILDHAKGKTLTSYCDRGLLRFVKGEYAWANSEAFMLGYVRDGSSIDAKLTPRLAEAMALNPRPYLLEALPVHVGPIGLDLAHTQHGRDFVYSCQAPPNSPGPILIWHLWLS